MRLLEILRNLKRSFSSYQPVVEVFLSRANLLYNLQVYRDRFPNGLVAPVLKSNAYGHGLVPIARTLDRENLPFFCVDSLYEAAFLRHEGIRTPLLVLGFTSAENIISSRVLCTAFALVDMEQLQQVATTLRYVCEFHLKIDTGMHRQGIGTEQIDATIKLIKSNRYMRLTGVCSHLADADNSNESFTLRQIEIWEKAVKRFKREFTEVQYYHLSATSGARYADRITSNCLRLGIGLYGINVVPSELLSLRPVLRMETVVGSVRKLRMGECVGYGATYRAREDKKIATVPVGYFEGVDRRLSNKGSFEIAGHNCPIVGRVSMNITSIDVSVVPDVKVGDRVTIISDDPKDQNSVENMARLADTIPYEILVHIPQHLRRRVIIE